MRNNFSIAKTLLYAFFILVLILILREIVGVIIFRKSAKKSVKDLFIYPV